MPDGVVIGWLTDLSRARLADMLAESEAAGYRFVRRLVEEWDAGINCFCTHILELVGRQENAQRP